MGDIPFNFPSPIPGGGRPGFPVLPLPQVHGPTQLRDIPPIMDAQGWRRAALLLRKWFSRPPTTSPRYTAPDTTTITMAWVLGFHRARVVFDNIVDQRLWQNPAARRKIKEMLARKRLLGHSTPRFFGDLDAPVPTQDADYIQFRASEMNLTRIATGQAAVTELDAALGNFVFRVVLAGEVLPVTRGSSRQSVRVDEVGIYVRDSFDFEGFQPLGTWNYGSRSLNGIGRPVFNHDFQLWRWAYNHGGDFLIFSDLRRMVEPYPEEIELP